MKKHVLKSLLGLALIALTLSSCELFDTADDFTFDVKLEHTFVINEQFDSKGQPMSYASTDSWDPSSNAEFQKYKDKIKSVKVNKVTYTVSDYSGAGDISFTAGQGRFKASSNAGTALAAAGISFQNILSSVGGNYELGYAIADLDKIGEHLKTVGPVFFEVSGTFSKTPVAFKVPTTIHCTITAEAL